MKNFVSREEIISIRKKLKEENKKVVFTNGVFDILHPGHVDYLNKAKALGDILIVGLNSDASVKRIKGEKRPIFNQEERGNLLASLKPVDYVSIFEEDTPFNIISDIIPDILVKGGDWSIDNIVGRDIVEANGGLVTNIKFITSQSTSNIINIILKRYDA